MQCYSNADEYLLSIELNCLTHAMCHDWHACSNAFTSAWPYDHVWYVCIFRVFSFLRIPFVMVDTCQLSCSPRNYPIWMYLDMLPCICSCNACQFRAQAIAICTGARNPRCLEGHARTTRGISCDVHCKVQLGPGSIRSMRHRPRSRMAHRFLCILYPICPLV